MITKHTFLSQKEEGWKKKSYHSILQKTTIREQHCIFSISCFIQIILTGEESPTSGVTGMSSNWQCVLSLRLPLPCSHEDWTGACRLWKLKHSQKKLISTMFIRIQSSGSSFLWAFKGSTRGVFNVEITGWIVWMENTLNPQEFSRITPGKRYQR